jgi:c-di-GMP-binding flagellar brake protein YcgR
MTSVPGVDHPEEQTDADVTLTARGISVNARVESVGRGPVLLNGESLDLSEDGVRARFDGFGALPEAGAPEDLTVALEDGELSTKAEIVRAQARGARWLMSIRFVSIPEKEQDRVRRRVFQALREERARSVE